MKSAQRPEQSWPPGAENPERVRSLVDHAEHDRADKRERDIRGHNAQFAGESHGKPPSVYVGASHNAPSGESFPPEKGSLAAPSRSRNASVNGDVVKES
jgi:hypothetical protein